MRTYKLYWIQSKAAHHFYHKGDVLYRFLLEHLYKRKEHTNIQYEYITNDIPHDEIINFIIEKGKHFNINVDRNGDFLILYLDETKVKVQIKKRSIEVITQTLHCAEKVIFPILRSFEQSFFIVGEAKDEYGWISPLQTYRQNIPRERLYSFP